MSVRRKTVLVIDADDHDRERLAVPLRREYRVLRAASGEAALPLMEREDVDIVVADAKLSGLSALELLHIVRENYPLVESILVAEASDVEGAVQAIKLGAYHYLAKSSEPDTLRATVAHAAQRQDLNRRVLTLRAEVQEIGDREFIAGPQSLDAGNARRCSRRWPRLSATVLILGESGTGKELLARLIHNASASAPGGGGADRPFIAINLAAIPRELVESTLFGHERSSFTGALQQRIGKFELASGGTLFLDEIGDLRLELQAKLLRAIQEGEIERVGGGKPIKTFFRLIAATNVDLERAVKDGTFREDLFYRLNVIPVRLPPLRERIEDLPELAPVFSRSLQRAVPQAASVVSRSRPYACSPSPMARQRPRARESHRTRGGNRRRRMDHRRRSPVRVHRRGADHEKTDGSLLERALMTFERNFIVRGLERSGWNVTQTARYLGVPLSTLKFKMDRLEIRDIARRIKGG